MLQSLGLPSPAGGMAESGPAGSLVCAKPVTVRMRPARCVERVRAVSPSERGLRSGRGGGEWYGTVRRASEGLVAACELQEEVLVQLLPSGPLPRGQENVAPDVLVHNAAAGRHAAESHVDVFVKLDGHLRGGQSEGLVVG